MAPIFAFASALIAVSIPVYGLLPIPTIIGIAFLGVIIQLLYRLHCNIEIAKSTGLPYVLTPVDQFDMFSFVLGNRKWYQTVVKSLPFGMGKWYDWTHDNYKWRRRRAEDSVYKYVGSEVYIAVSPAALVVNVANPEAIADLALKRTMVQKPADGFLGEYPLFIT